MFLYKMRGVINKLTLLCSVLFFILISMTTFQWRTPTSLLGNHDNPQSIDVRMSSSGAASGNDKCIGKDQRNSNVTGINNTRHTGNKRNATSGNHREVPIQPLLIQGQNGDQPLSPESPVSQGNEIDDVDVDVTKRGVHVRKVEVAGGLRKMFQYVHGTVSANTRSDNKSLYKVAANITQGPRLLCWILTDPSDLDRRTKHVKATWASRCDITLYMSSIRNDSFPTVGLNVKSGRNHIASKAKAAWRYIHNNYLNKADFFLKADPDTYVIVENLKEYISHQDSKSPVYFGHRFYQPEWGYTYMSGGAGLVLTRESLRRLVEEAFAIAKPDCMPDGQGEDWKTAKCLSLVGATSVDTRDSAGRERFLVFNPSAHVRGRYPEWYTKRDPDGALKGDKCCSNYPISFHYIKPDEMYVLDYFLYRARPHGKELVNL